MGRYVPINRRRREGVTDYGARKKAIVSHKTLLVVRITGKNISAQFVKPQVKGDLVVASVHSRALRKLKWGGSLKSLPACYLLGLLAGKTGKAKGISEAVVYNGVLPFIKGSRLAAFIKGARDGGLGVLASEEVFPTEEKLKGESIATFAAALQKESKEAYQKKFSAMLKAGFKPEDYPARVEEMKLTILGGGKK
ncbi:MAG: 50S ribosomal protein L18 [Thaumarchaeota archaeon]|nr:50S ribosomal protein L18 [Nitrososphaerota archaeon]